MTEIYLGKPPAYIEEWIKAHSQPAGHPETRVTYTAASGLPDWSGEIEGTLSSNSIPNKNYIETIDIGTSVTSIGWNAFGYCPSLMSVMIGNSVTRIEAEAFRNCSSLTSVTIPYGVTSIEWGTFYQCTNLTSMTIPNSVTSIEGEAFSDCNNALFDTWTISGVKLVDGWAVGKTGSPFGVLDLTGVRGIGNYAF